MKELFLGHSSWLVTQKFWLLPIMESEDPNYSTRLWQLASPLPGWQHLGIRRHFIPTAQQAWTLALLRSSFLSHTLPAAYWLLFRTSCYCAMILDHRCLSLLPLRDSILLKLPEAESTVYSSPVWEWSVPSSNANWSRFACSSSADVIDWIVDSSFDIAFTAFVVD